jgi:hypothetical protein
MPSLSLGLGLHKNRVFTAGGGGAPFSPTDLSNLALWLKADAGITTASGTPFIGSVVITGAGTTTSNGTYTRETSGYSTYYKSGGGYINYGYNPTADGDVWQIYDSTLGSISYFCFSDDLISWNRDAGAANAPSGSTTNRTNPFVLSWQDQSGNGRNGTPQDIAPTLISSSSSLNNRSAISFNNNGSSLQIPQSDIGESGIISIFIVINYASGYIFLNKGDAANFENTSWEFSTITGFGFVNSYDGSLSWNVVPVSPNTNVCLLLEGFSNGGVSQLAYNGNNSGNPSSGNDGFNNLSQYIGIGAGGDGGAQANLDARIGEIIIYNRQVTTPERQQVEAYLNTKYAIY